MNYFVCNAFTSVPFAGNPATVCVPTASIAKTLTTEHMMRLAGELSSVETAFVLPPTEAKTDFTLRFFTKRKENPFCGHATIAAAHVLSTEFQFRSNDFFFETKGGIVVVKRTNGKFFELNLRPTLPIDVTRQWGADGIVAKVMAALRFTATSGELLPSPEAHIRAVLLHEHSKNIILLLDAARVVVSAKPNFNQLTDVTPDGINKITITAIPQSQADVSASSAGNGDGGELAEAQERMWRKYDFVTRLFAPAFGINEDAVSGASHAILAKVWRGHSEALRAKTALCCFQPSPRGGEVMLDTSDPECIRVGVAGEAVTVAHGTTSFVKAAL